MSIERFLFVTGNDNNAYNEEFYGGRTIISSHVQANETLYNFTTTMPTMMIDACDISKTGSVENISYALFMTVILIASVFGNSLVVLAFAMSKQLRNRVTVYFIVSLACSDMAFAIFLIPFNISMKLFARFCHNMAACYLMVVSDSFCNVASILNLFLIAVDRFIAIRMPFRYTALLPARRAKKLIAGAWIFAVIWSISGLITWKRDETNNTVLSVHLTSFCLNKNYYYYATSFFGIYLLPLVIMSGTYLIILHLALAQIRAIESTTVDLQATADNASPELNASHVTIRCKKSRKRKRKRELKATKSVAIVYFAFLVCWFPNCVINVMIMFDNSYFPALRKTNKTLFLFIFYCFIQILPLVNTMVNPIIYSFANKQFRHGFRSVYHKLMRKFDITNSYLESSRRNTRGFSFGGSFFSTPTSSSVSSNLNSQKQSRSSPVLLKKTSLDQTNCYNGSFLNNDTERKLVRIAMVNTEVMWKPD